MIQNFICADKPEQLLDIFNPYKNADMVSIDLDNSSLVCQSYGYDPSGVMGTFELEANTKYLMEIEAYTFNNSNAYIYTINNTVCSKIIGRDHNLLSDNPKDKILLEINTSTELPIHIGILFKDPVFGSGLYIKSVVVKHVESCSSNNINNNVAYNASDKDKIYNLEQSNIEIKEFCKNLISRIEKLELENKELNNSLCKINTELVDKNELYSLLTERLTKLEEMMKNMDNSIYILGKEQFHINNEIVEDRISYAKKNEDLTKKQEVFGDGIIDIAMQIDKLANKISKLESYIQDNKIDVKKLHDSITMRILILEDSASNYQKFIDVFENRFDIVDNIISKLNNDITYLDNTLKNKLNITYMDEILNNSKRDTDDKLNKLIKKIDLFEKSSNGELYIKVDDLMRDIIEIKLTNDKQYSNVATGIEEIQINLNNYDRKIMNIRTSLDKLKNDQQKIKDTYIEELKSKCEDPFKDEYENIIWSQTENTDIYPEVSEENDNIYSVDGNTSNIYSEVNKTNEVNEVNEETDGMGEDFTIVNIN